jgi:hypothetical protein
VIKANRGKLFLPPEPLRADYVEIVESPVFITEKKQAETIVEQPLIEAKSIEASKTIIAIEAKTETEITETETAQVGIEPVTVEETAIEDEETVTEEETVEETVANIPVTNYEEYCRKWYVNNKRGVI